MKHLKKMICLVMAVLFALSMVDTTAFAAGYEPYGFSWYDSNAKVWHVQYYEYDSNASAYRISDRVIVKDNLLYDLSGTLIVSDVAKYTEGSPTVAFDSDGALLFISTSGELRKMESSLENTYATYAVSGFKAKYFEFDNEDLAKYVRSASAKKTLSTLSFTGSNLRHVDPVVTDGYVRMYAVEGNAEKVGYDAYYNNSVVSTIHAWDAKVWSETFKVTVSESSRGAKFIGFTSEYGVILNDLDGNVLLYKYENSYKKYSVLYKNVEVYYFTKDSKGFISGVVTSQGTYTISTDIKFPGASSSGNGGNNNNAGSTGSVTKVKNFIKKSMAYEGDVLVSTLSVKSNDLYWKGKKLKNSTKSREFGISKSNTPFWINDNDDLLYYDGTNSQLISVNVLRLKFDTDGRVIEFKAFDGNWYPLW